jgi:hypothetical protein
MRLSAPENGHPGSSQPEAPIEFESVLDENAASGVG